MINGERNTRWQHEKPYARKAHVDSIIKASAIATFEDNLVSVGKLKVVGKLKIVNPAP